MFGKKKMITLVAILLAAALTGCGATDTDSGIVSDVVTEALTETEAPTVGDIPTNSELLTMINSAFGIMTDNTVEGNIQEARDWDIIGENDVIDPDASITAEFLIFASMRATGFVTGNSTMAEILECALQRGVITDTDLSADKLPISLKRPNMHGRIRNSTT